MLTVDTYELVSVLGGVAASFAAIMTIYGIQRYRDAERLRSEIFERKMAELEMKLDFHLAELRRLRIDQEARDQARDRIDREVREQAKSEKEPT